jgi:hypothetical protein
MPQDQIFILDLMYGHSEPPDGVTAEDLARSLDEVGLDASTIPCGNRGQLYDGLERIRQKLLVTSAPEKRMPFVHFFGHGHVDGIELYDDGRREIVEWKSLSELIAPVSRCRDGVILSLFRLLSRS